MKQIARRVTPISTDNWNKLGRAGSPLPAAPPHNECGATAAPQNEMSVVEVAFEIYFAIFKPFSFQDSKPPSTSMTE